MNERLIKLREMPPRQSNPILDLQLLKTIGQSITSQFPPTYPQLSHLYQILTHRNNKYSSVVKIDSKKFSINYTNNHQINQIKQSSKLANKQFAYNYTLMRKQTVKLCQNFTNLSITGLEENYKPSIVNKIKNYQLPHRIALQLQSTEHILQQFYQTRSQQKICGKHLLQILQQKKQCIFSHILLNFLQNIEQNKSIYEFVNKTISKIITELQQKVIRSEIAKRQNNNYEQRWQIIFWLFLGGQTNRSLLFQLLYLEDDVQLFNLIHQYDQLFTTTTNRILSIQILRNYEQRVRKWVQKISQDSNSQKKMYVRIIGSVLNCFSLQQQQQLSLKINSQYKILITLYCTLKWLQIDLCKQQDNITFKNQKIAKFVKNKQNLIDPYIDKLELKERLRLSFNLFSISKFINSSKYDPLNQVNDVEMSIILAVLLNQRQHIEGILNLLDPNCNFDLIKIKLKQLLTKFAEHHLGIGYSVSMLPFLCGENEYKDFILMKKQLVEEMAWEKLALFMPQQKIQDFIKDVIFTSITKFKNASTFINSMIPEPLKPSFFDLQLMVKGLTHVLTGQMNLSEPNRSKYFGMLSVFRGENIPQKHLFDIVKVEMLFEWYVLKSMIEQRNVKGIINSLLFNLQQYEEHEFLESKSIRGVSSSHGSHEQIHNKNYSNKIWEKWFIEQLGQCKMFIGFISCIMDGLLLIFLKYQKSVRRQKMDTWVESFLEKLGDAIRFTRNSGMNSLLIRKHKQYCNLLEKIGH